MPKHSRIIPEVMTHMVHPITEQLTARMLGTLGVTNIFKDTKYYYSEDTKATKTTDDKHRPILTTDVCVIDLDVHMNPNDAKWPMISFRHTPSAGLSARYNTELQPMFCDINANIMLLEQAVPCWVGLNISMKFRSKELAFMTLDRLRGLYFNSSIVEYDDIVYDYPIDQHLLLIMYRLYKMRKLINPLSFKEYLYTGSNGGITKNVSRSGKDFEIVILKNQFRILTEVSNIPDKPEVETVDNLPKRFIVNFTYDVQFTRPSALQLNYPVVIDNQFVPPEDIQPPGRSHPTLSDVIGVDTYMQAYIYKRYVDSYPHGLIRFPYWDDWELTNIRELTRMNYNPFFVGALTLDENESGETITKINLQTDFPEDYSFHPVLLDSIRVAGPAVFMSDGLFNISVFANDIRVDPSLLEMSSDLVLTIKSTAKNKQYHLVFSELIDLTYLNPRYIPILIKYHEFYYLTIIRNLERLVKLGILYIREGIVYCGIDQRIYAKDILGYYGLPETTDPSVMDPEHYGADYSELEGYEDILKLNIYTKSGTAILRNQGGSYGFISPFRVGRYIIEPKRESAS